MYCDFYELRERPFNVTSDPKFLYLNACYREALASLHYGISQRKGFITLIGEAGTGKTTLLKKLLDDLDQHTRTVFIFNTNVSFDEILEYIFSEFDLPIQNGKRLPMLQRFNGFLLEELSKGRNMALLIDEAQDLEYSVLEDLRLLSNLETAKEKILQIVLSGQPELAQKLSNPGLRQLRQRISINCRLMALCREEVSNYIRARLGAAGSGDPELFSRDAEDRIFEISKGIPRLVNVVCDNALVIGYALGKQRINADVVSEAAADLFSTEPVRMARESANAAPVELATARESGWGRWLPSQFALVALAVITIVLGVLSVGRSLLRWDTDQPVRPPAPRAPLEVVQPRVQFENRRDSSATSDGTVAARAARRDALRGIGSLGAPQDPAVGEARRDRSGPRPVETVEGGGDLQAVGSGLPPAAGGVTERAHPWDLDQREPRRPPPSEGGNAVPAGAAVRPSRPGGRAQAAVGSAPAQVEEKDLSAAQKRKVGGGPAGAETQRAAVEMAAIPSVQRTALDEPKRGAPRGFEGHRPGVRNDGAGAKSGVVLSVPHYQEIRVHDGDSLSRIAVRNYGKSNYTFLDLLKLANPRIRNVDEILVGQRLRLPELDEGVALLRQPDGKQALLLFSTAFRNRARRLQQVLSQRGFKAQIKKSDFGSGRTVYRVIVPDQADRDSAVATGRELQKLFRQDDEFAALTQ